MKSVRLKQWRKWIFPQTKGVVVFLSGNSSDYISGAVIPVDGGYLGK